MNGIWLIYSLLKHVMGCMMKRTRESIWVLGSNVGSKESRDYFGLSGYCSEEKSKTGWFPKMCSP